MEAIHAAFSGAFSSSSSSSSTDLSLVVLDDLHRLVEFMKVGTQITVSHELLHTITTLLTSPIPTGLSKFFSQSIYILHSWSRFFVNEAPEKIFASSQFFVGRRNAEIVHVEWIKGYYGLVTFTGKNDNFHFSHWDMFVLLLLSTISMMM